LDYLFVVHNLTSSICLYCSRTDRSAVLQVQDLSFFKHLEPHN